MKPETISHYGENANFTCDRCVANVTPTATNPSYRLPNISLRIKSTDSVETDYRNFTTMPSKSNLTPAKNAPIANTAQYFTEKPSYTKSKRNEYDEHIPSQMNGKNKLILHSRYSFDQFVFFKNGQFNSKIEIQQSTKEESLWVADKK